MKTDHSYGEDFYNELITRILSVLDFPEPLQQICDICFDFWNSPLNIYDTSFKLISRSSKFQSADDKVLRIFEAGYMLQDAIKILDRQKRLTVYNSANPYLITDINNIEEQYRIKGQDYGYLDVPIRAQGNIIGLMALIPMERPLTDADGQCLTEIARIVSLILQKDRAYMYSVRDRYEALFREILSGDLKDKDTIELRLINLGKNTGRLNRIAIVTLPDAAPGESRLKNVFLQSGIRDIMPDTITAFYNEEIVFLVSSDKPSADLFNTRFREFIKLHKLHAGVSREFTDLSLIRRHYDQARSIIAVKPGNENLNHIIFYDKFYLHHELQIVAEHADLMDFCEPSMIKVSNSNRKTDGELLQTLYCYLVFSKNWEKVCNILHIHKSTLFYRIKVIKERLGITLENGYEIYKIMHSFHILRTIGMFTPEWNEVMEK